MIRTLKVTLGMNLNKTAWVAEYFFGFLISTFQLSEYAAQNHMCDKGTFYNIPCHFQDFAWLFKAYFIGISISYCLTIEYAAYTYI